MVKSGFIPGAIPTELAAELAELGWRTEVLRHADGTSTTAYVPLTSAEFLHPEEGYHLPNSTFHDKVSGDAKDMLTRRYASDPTIAVFRDLLILVSRLFPHPAIPTSPKPAATAMLIRFCVLVWLWLGSILAKVVEKMGF